MQKITYLLLCTLALLWACQTTEQEGQTEGEESTASLQTGVWHANIQLKGGDTPFQMDVQKEGDKYLAYLINGEERLELDEIEIKGDSIKMVLHIFDAALIGKIEEGKKITGHWAKYGYKEPYEVPFQAEYGLDYRFKEGDQAAGVDFSGTWKVEFADESGDTYPALGIFEQTGKKIK